MPFFSPIAGFQKERKAITRDKLQRFALKAI